MTTAVTARTRTGRSLVTGAEFDMLAAFCADEYGLDVLTRGVVHTADRWLASECGVAAVVVVGVEEVCQCVGAFGVAGVGPQIGPFVEQGGG